MLNCKKVGKRILGLLLTVCLVLGLLPDMPVVYAAGNDISTATISLFMDPECVSAPVTEEDTYTYTGTQIKPYVKVVCDGKTLELNRDYTVTYGANTNAGKGNVTIYSSGSYTGSKSIDFAINKVKLDSISVACSLMDTNGIFCYYDGNGNKPVVQSVTGKSENSMDWTLTSKDYSIPADGYGNNTAVYTSLTGSRPYFTIKLSENGNFEYEDDDTKKIYYRIYYSMDNVKVNGIDNNTMTFTGFAQTPSFTVTNTLDTTANVTYTYEWTNDDKYSNINAGTAALVLYGNGAYKGNKTFTYPIKQANIEDVTVLFDPPTATYDYTGAKIDMDSHITVKLGDYVVPASNYTLSYQANYKGDVGTNWLFLAGGINFYGTKSEPFKIVSKLAGCTLDETELTYDGSKRVPGITVKDGKGNTVSSLNYTVTYYTSADYSTASQITAPTEVGTYYIQVIGNSENAYSGTLGSEASPISYEIVPKSIGSLTFKLNGNIVTSTSETSAYFNGKSHRTAMSNLVITDGSKTLEKDTDYGVEFYSDSDYTQKISADSDFINAGTYYIKVTGQKSYLHSDYTLTYTIMVLPISNPTIDVKDQTYTGSTITPSRDDITITAIVNGNQTTITTFEVIPCSNNGDIGTADIIVRLTGNYTTGTTTTINNVTYTGTALGTFRIVPKKISQCTIDKVDSVIYNGQTQNPTVVVKDGNKTLVNPTDYTVGYYTGSACLANQAVSGVKDAGSYWIKISGQGIYAASDDYVIFQCNVVPKAFTTADITFTASNCDYTGSPVTPVLTVKDGGTELSLGTDYSLTGYYEDEACTTPKSPVSGKCYVKISGNNNYSGTKTTVFYIGKDIMDLSPTIELSGKALVYNTKSHYTELSEQLIVRDSAGEVVSPNYYDVHYYSDSAYKTEVTNSEHDLFKNAGSIYISITGKNGYYGNYYDKCTIATRTISTMDAVVLGTYTYTGSAIALTINDETDLTKTDGIVMKYPATEAIDYTLKASDYTITSYSDNKNAGTATVTLTGKGNYTGTKTINFTINSKSLNDLANLVVTIPSATFTSRKQSPTVNVTYGDRNTALLSGTDFTVAYYKDSSYSTAASDADLTNAGAVYVKITGKNNYKDVVSDIILGGTNKFTINPRDINEADVSIAGLSYVYSAIANTSKIPTFTVKYAYVAGSYYTLTETEDYTYTPTEVGYHIGSQDIDVKGTGNFTGIKTVKYYYLGNMNNSANEIYVEGIADSYAYTADTATKGITCSNIVVYATGGERIDSSCYTVAYKNNKAAGTATVEIKGNTDKYWTGTYTKDFKITGSVADAQITIPTQLYTGTAYTADTLKDIQVACDGYNLQYGIDYDIIAVANATDAALSTAASAPTITIKGKGDYFSGTATIAEKFSIKYDINSASLQISDIQDQIYTGGAIEPAITVKYQKLDGAYASLTKDVDYTVKYYNNTAVASANGTKGPYAVIASTGTGLLTDGSLTVPFSIGQVNLEDESLGYYIDGVESEYLYTGAVIKPTVVVKDKNGTVLADTNYKVDYTPSNLVEAGSVITIKVTGKGNYYGAISTSFQIIKRKLDTSKDEVTVTIPDQTYAGKELKPTFRVEFTDYAGKTQAFTEGKDFYIVGYYNNINASEAGLAAYEYIDGPYVQIKAVDGRSLTGTRNIPFTILPKSMENLVYSAVADMTYEPGRSEYKPEVSIKLAKDSTDYLENLKDYRLIYHNYTSVADANGVNGPYIEVIPYDDNENLTGTKIIPYSIKKRSLKSEDIVVVLSDSNEANKFDPVKKNYPNVGTYYPTVRVFDYFDPDNPVELVSGTDFTLGTPFAGNGQVGTVTITITGKTNYVDSISEYFTIGTLFDTEHISVTQNNSPLVDGKLASATYNGKKQLPEAITVKVISTAKELALGTDYAVEIFLDSGCTRAATEDSVCNAGTYYFRIRGLTSAGFIGSIVMPYTIKQKNLNASSVKVEDIPDQPYGDGNVRPSLNITDEETGEKIPTSQYEVIYDNKESITIGNTFATIVANENGNYTGSRKIEFCIVRQDIDEANVYGISDQDYTGSEIRPDPQVYFNGTQLINGTDYIATYGNNTDAGQAWIIIQGTGNYTGVTKEICFKIKANLETAVVSTIENQVYTGKQVTPKPAAVTCGGNKLKEGVDYILDYEPNIIIGDGAVIILPKNEYYTGSKVIKFQICNSIASATISNVPTSQTYTTAPITPEPTVKVGNTVLKRDVHYTVKWSNDVNVGTAAITVTGIGAYSGTKTIKYNIIAKSIARCTLSSVGDKNYNGKAQSPAITVKDGSKVLAKDTDYTITYTNNKDIGTAVITVVGKGNYSGSTNVKFNIISAPVTGLKASGEKKTSAKISWSKAANITGYQVYTNDSKTRVAQTAKTSATIKKLKAGTTYKYKVRTYTKIGNKTFYGDFKTITFATQPEKPKVTVKSSKTKTAKISWKKVSGSNGFEIYCSTAKKGTYKPIALIIKNNVLSYTNTGLTKGKTYYYKVRAYRIINGKKIYGAFSDAASVKVK